MIHEGAYLNAQCIYNKFQDMLLEHVGLSISIQMIHAPGAYAPGAAAPGIAAPGA